MKLMRCSLYAMSDHSNRMAMATQGGRPKSVLNDNVVSAVDLNQVLSEAWPTPEHT